VYSTQNIKHNKGDVSLKDNTWVKFFRMLMMMWKCCNCVISYDAVDCLQVISSGRKHFSLHNIQILSIVWCFIIRMVFLQLTLILSSGYMWYHTALHISRSIHITNKIMIRMLVFFDTQCNLTRPPPHHFVKSWISFTVLSLNMVSCFINHYHVFTLQCLMNQGSEW